MAETAGYAVLQVIPSMRGTRKMLEAALNGPAQTAGKTAGQRTGAGVVAGMSARLRSSGSGIAKVLGSALGRPGERAGDNVGHSIGGALDTALGKSVEAAGRRAGLKLVAAVGGAVATIPGAIAPATGALLALPAAAGVAAAGMAVLATGVHGVGDALKAAAEGDAEKLNEALAELSPNARAFVRSFQGISEQFAPVRRAVQDRLFAGIGAQMRELASTSMPMLRTGMTDVASSINGLGREALKTASTPMFQGSMATILAGTAAATDSFRGAVGPLMTVLAELSKVGLPLIEQMGRWATESLQGAAGFLSSKEGAEAMSGALDRAVGVLGQLTDIGTNVGGILANVFGAGAADGQGLLDTLERLTGQWAAWTGSAEGQARMGEIFSALSGIFESLLTILPQVANVLTTVTSAFSSLSPEMQSAVTQGLAWSIVLAPLLGRVGGLVSGVGALGRVVGGTTKAITGTIGAGRRLVQGFQDARVAASAFSGRAGQLGGALRKGWDGATKATRRGASAVASGSKRAWSAVRTGAASAGRGVTTAASTLGRGAARAGTALGRMAAQAAAASARMVASLGRMAAQAAIASARMVASLARMALQTALNAGRVVAGWVLMGVQSLIQAARMAAAWLIAMGPIGWVIAAVVGLVALIIANWDKVVSFTRKAWTWLKDTVVELFRTTVAWVTARAQHIVRWLQLQWQQLKARTLRTWMLLKAAVVGAVTGLRDRAVKLATNIRDWVLDKILRLKARGEQLFAQARATIQRTVLGLRQKVVGFFSNIRDWVVDRARALRSRVTDAIDSMRSRVISSFRRAKDGVQKVWSKLQSVAKKPVRFVIQRVYNDGIRKVWNWVAEKVGLGTLDRVKLPAGFARGGVLPGQSTWRQGDDQLVPMRKGEGVAVSEAMRVPALRNELLRWNSIGVSGGTSALQRYAQGERPPMGTSRGVRDMAQGAGFAKGGILGNVADFGKDIAKGFLTGGFGKAVNKVTAPLTDVIASKFGKSGFEGLPTRAIGKLVGNLKKKLKSFLGFFSGGADDWVGMESASKRLRRAARWVDTQVGKPYQWGGGGNPSWDCSGFMAGIENKIRGIAPGRRYTTMDFRGSSAPSGWQQGLRSPFEVGVVNGASARGSHMAGTLLGVNVESSGSRGVHKGRSARGSRSGYFSHQYGFKPVAGGRALGGLVYDDGGMLQPGLNLVDNQSGKPEPVYTAAQQDRIDRLVSALEKGGHRVGHTFYISGDGQPRRTARHVATALSDWENLHPTP